jgi:hypothetical protein
VQCMVSILSSAGFERDSLWFGFGIGFRVYCDLGKNFHQLLRSRPQVEDEFGSVTWAMGSVQTCVQCGDRRSSVLNKRGRRERPVQGIHVPGIGLEMRQSGQLMLGKEMERK